MTELTLLPDPLGKLAAAQFRSRQAKARDMVRDRKVSEAEATARLRPWLAIACLCGADLPELHELLADERVVHVDDAGPAPAKAGVSEAEARSLVARDICPRAEWLAPLTAARDIALEHHDRLHRLSPDPAHPERRRGAPEPGELRAALANAAALARIAPALGVPPYQPKSAHPEQRSSEAESACRGTNQQRTAA